jgi:hypothetical protein
LNNGLADYAVTNNIILLYPQVDFHYSKNPTGCWDFAQDFPSARLKYNDGSKDPEDYFYTNEGVQNKAIKAMIDKLTEEKTITEEEWGKLESPILDRAGGRLSNWGQFWSYTKGWGYMMYSMPLLFCIELRDAIVNIYRIKLE